MIERVRLGDVAVIEKGTVPARPTATGRGEPFFGLSEIGSAGAGPVRRVVPEPNLKVVRLERGDVVVGLLSRIGETALVSETYVSAVLGRECAVIRARPSVVTGAWIYVWTFSTDFREQVDRHVGGSTMPRLSTRALPDFTLPVPSTEHQSSVKETLARLEGAILSTSRVLSDLTELKRVEVDIALATLNDSSAPEKSKGGVRKKLRRG